MKFGIQEDYQKTLETKLMSGSTQPVLCHEPGREGWIYFQIFHNRVKVCIKFNQEIGAYYKQENLGTITKSQSQPFSFDICFKNQPVVNSYSQNQNYNICN